MLQKLAILKMKQKRARILEKNKSEKDSENKHWARVDVKEKRD